MGEGRTGSSGLLAGTPFECTEQVFFETLPAYLLRGIVRTILVGVAIAGAGWLWVRYSRPVDHQPEAASESASPDPDRT